MKKKKLVCKSDHKLANKKNHIRQLKANRRLGHDRIIRIRALELAKREAEANA